MKTILRPYELTEAHLDWIAETINDGLVRLGPACTNDTTTILFSETIVQEVRPRVEALLRASGWECVSWNSLGSCTELVITPSGPTRKVETEPKTATVMHTSPTGTER